VFVDDIVEFTARDIQKTWENSHVVYPLTLGRLGSAAPSAFATLGSSEETGVLFEEYL
jgi:hypothetical protein